MQSAIMVVIISVAIAIVLAISRKEAHRAETGMTGYDFTVRQPKAYMWVGIVCMVFSAGLMILAAFYPNETATWWVYLIFFLFFLLGAFLVVYCARWEMRVSGNIVMFLAPFVKPREFDIRTIERVKLIAAQNQALEKMKIYVDGKRLITVEEPAVGYAVLRERLAREGIPFY